MQNAKHSTVLLLALAAGCGKTLLLHDAVSDGDVEAVELLLANGVDVDAKRGDDQTPLQWAVDRGRTEMADLLRKHGTKQ